MSFAACGTGRFPLTPEPLSPVCTLKASKCLSQEERCSFSMLERRGRKQNSEFCTGTPSFYMDFIMKGC
jgi:hypothetical protein